MSNGTCNTSLSRSSDLLSTDISKINDMSNGEQHFPRVASMGRFSQDQQPEGRVLVLYTGGTIGMVRNKDKVLAPLANAFVKLLRSYPNMHDQEYADERFRPDGPLVLPLTDTNTKRVIYNVKEYSPLLDSSNMTMTDWIRIANDIRESYEHFDGFVVLHGTDTLSYTASALSFMLEALGKIVILTGSQVPIFETRSDGIDNFLSSLIIAANYNIPEVCIYFGHQLLRGNRTTKSSASSFEAFHSPNASPLAIAGIKIEVDYRSIFRPCGIEKFHVHTNLNRNVGLVRLFPSITSDSLRALLMPPIEGVVLQSYGAGNVPSNRDDIMKEFKAATKRGVIIINITQCPKGSVSSEYEAGATLLEAGVTSGFDMTPEAALTKLAYVLSIPEWDIETKRAMMETNLRGEMTCEGSAAHTETDLIDAVAQSLRICSMPEMNELRTILFPSLLHAAVVDRDTKEIDSLLKHGADILQSNADGRTALHVACCEGDMKVVRHLLKKGASVHVKDRFTRTPLTDAIEYDRHEIIKLLTKCGAHLHESDHVIGEKLCIVAAAGNVKRLSSYHLAGANLSQGDTSGRTALHLAALHNRLSAVRFLLDNGAKSQVQDMLGHTPRDLAESASATECLKLLPVIHQVSKA